MKITEVSVRRAVTFAMIYLIAVGFGLFSLARLKLDLYPKLEFPIIAIISQYTGVGPFDLETVVTRQIEEVVACKLNRLADMMNRTLVQLRNPCRQLTLQE